MDGTDSRNGELDTVRERLNVVTQETRFSLIQDIFGHPSGLPTLKELDYVNPSRSQTTIRQHLQRLGDAGIVENVELPEDRRQNDLPYTFYGLSDKRRRFLSARMLRRIGLPDSRMVYLYRDNSIGITGDKTNTVRYDTDN
jgi:DNA-binding HxlR family transcriptional regulator